MGLILTAFFELTEQPRRVAVVGAGYIAVELASILNALGTQTHLVYRFDTVLRRFDTDLIRHLHQHFAQRDLQCHSNHVPCSLQRNANGTFQLNFETNPSLDNLDCVIWAIGRDPRTLTLNLNAAGVATDERGAILTDAYQTTNVPHIYALGDVTNRMPLTPVAIAAGRRLADRLFGGEPHAHFDYNTIPTVVFTHPPLATVGLTEAQALASYEKSTIEIKETYFTAMSDALDPNPLKTYMKLILQGESQQVVGCHLLGLHTDEMLQGFAVAIKMGATLADFKATVAIHPTSAEEIVTI